MKTQATRPKWRNGALAVFHTTGSRDPKERSSVWAKGKNRSGGDSTAWSNGTAALEVVCGMEEADPCACDPEETGGVST